MTSAEAGGRIDVRLVPAALTAWAVTAAGVVWSYGGAITAAFGTTAFAAAAAWWGRGRPGRDALLPALGAGVVAVAVVGAGFAVAVGLRMQVLRHHPVIDRYGTAATVVITPSETPRSLGRARLMFRATLQSLDEDEMSGRVLVFTPVAGFAELSAGRPARFRATVGRPARRDLTVASLSATGRPTLGEAVLIQRVANRIRTAFAGTARAALPPDQAAMLPALVLGDTSAVSGHTAAEFRAAGLTHLTAVSGANVTIVCGTVLLTASLLGPRIAVTLAALVLVAFVVVVQPSASVLRAAVMGAITLLGVLAHRRRQALPVLAASVVVLMIGAPELSVDVGFALSVSATAALVMIAPVWSRRLAGRGWPRPLADAVSVAVAAQLVTAPLVAGISGTVSAVSVLANLAVAAVIPPVTVIGTAAAVMCAAWPSGAQLLIRFTGPELWWLLEVAHWSAGVPGAAVPVPSGLPGVLLVAVGGLAMVVLWRWRWVRFGVAGAVVCLLAWMVAGVVGVGPA